MDTFIPELEHAEYAQWTGRTAESIVPLIDPPHAKIEAVLSIVRRIAWALVDFSAEVTVVAIECDESTDIHLRVGSRDIGKIIGKQGRNAKSLRTLLVSMGMKAHHRYSLDIELNESASPD